MEIRWPHRAPGFITSATRREIYELSSAILNTRWKLFQQVQFEEGKIEAIIQLEKIRSVVKRESTIDPRLSTIVGRLTKSGESLPLGRMTPRWRNLSRPTRKLLTPRTRTIRSLQKRGLGGDFGRRAVWR